ncbi:uncharacterized protein LOC117238831 [Bombus vosnesenskii]|uniref:Uncharacterized protein LOC117238831 n=1 Tax=Bombus vosnesenskii TaxID=207650 RepID=A0A6J3L606_9HYME|nr:uncharacterized protein LOC117238831 [Bombus vosnesenskii]
MDSLFDYGTKDSYLVYGELRNSLETAFITFEKETGCSWRGNSHYGSMNSIVTTHLRIASETLLYCVQRITYHRLFRVTVGSNIDLDITIFSEKYVYAYGNYVWLINGAILLRN